MSATTTVSVKIVYGQDVRRISLQNLNNFSDLLNQVRSVFGFQPSRSFSLTYLDNENDQIVISSDIELVTAVEFANSTTKVLRLTLTENGAQQQQPQPAPIQAPIQPTPPVQQPINIPQSVQIPIQTQPTAQQGSALYPDLHWLMAPVQQQQQAARAATIPPTNPNNNNNNNNATSTTTTTSASPLVPLLDIPEAAYESLKDQNKKLACKFFKSWAKGLVSIQSENYLCGTYVVGGTQFVKTWRLKNEGLIPWQIGSGISLSWGHRLGETEIFFDRVVEHNQEIEVSLKLNAPAVGGKFWFVYRLHDHLGNSFGRPLKFKIRVVSNPNATTSNSSNDGEIAELLARLHSLGFNEDQINLHFLQKSKGNFDKCVKKLWKRQHKQQWSGCKRWNH